MKIARLPTGELKEFPPDMPDEEMDRQVRAMLGVPDPVNPDEALRTLLANASQQNETMQQTLMMVAQGMEALSQLVQAVAQGQQGSAEQLADGFARLERAFLAETKIVTDANNRPLGMKKVL